MVDSPYTYVKVETAWFEHIGREHLRLGLTSEG